MAKNFHKVSEGNTAHCILFLDANGSDGIPEMLVEYLKTKYPLHN